jgi:magnesium chelatase subunit D
VSPHLLDRFALRLFDQQVSTTDRGEAVWEFASGGGEPAREHRDPIPDAISERLLAASTRSIPMEPGVTSEVVSLSKLSDGVRRDLALARLARGLARWNEAKAVGVDHVRQAAELLDIAPKTAVIPAAADGTDSALETAEVAKPSSERVQDGAPEVLQAESIEKPSGEMPPGEIVFEADTEVAFPAKATLAGAYPEDTTPAWRPMDSLKLPAGSAGTTKSNEGPAIGTQPAVAVRDIAFVSTILEAAKYQNIRDVAPDDFRLERGDLRSYRRAPLPQQLFVCLFDHTSTQDCDWETALLPHLQWAYVSRARVSLIQVGAGNAGEPLRATQINARSLLSRAISKALEQPPGNASPLAHGLHLAVRALHAAVERGRGRARHARFVILSDGRGNVPLEASQRGEITQAVGNRGVADAIEIGRELVTMNYVESFFLDPQPQQYPDLPVTLARVMGAELQAVPIRKIEVARG